MKYRTKILGLSVLLAVLVITYVSSFLMGSEGTRREAGPLIPAVSGPDSVTSLEIHNQESSYILRRGSGDDWLISGTPAAAMEGEFPGDKGRIVPFVEDLLACRREVAVTEDPGKHAQFEVEDGSLPRVTLGHAEGEVTVFFGKAGAGGLGEYARVEGEQEVVTTDRMSTYLGRNLVYWGDLSLLPESVTEQNLVSITCRGRKNLNPDEEIEEYTLRKTGDTDDSWVINGGDTAPDPVVVERLVRNLVNLKGNDFASDASLQNSGEAPALVEIVILTAGGEEYTLRAAPAGSEGDSLIVTVSGRKTPLKISRPVLERICIPAAQLFG